MKFFIVAILALIALIPPVTSAWKLNFYEGELYENEVYSREGVRGQPCKTLPVQARAKASSMKWDAEIFSYFCELKLFAGTRCTGTQLGRTKMSDWNIPHFSSAADKRVRSYKIGC
jgi:hypothetical protein